MQNVLKVKTSFLSLKMFLVFILIFVTISYSFDIVERNIPDSSLHRPNYQENHYFTVKFHPIVDNNEDFIFESSHSNDPHYAIHDPIAKEDHADFYFSMAKNLENKMKNTLECLGRSANLHNIYLFRTTNIEHDLKFTLKTIQEDKSVKWAGHNFPKKKLFKRSPPLEEAEKTWKKLNITDPAFPKQWHLVRKSYLLKT